MDTKDIGIILYKLFKTTFFFKAMLKYICLNLLNLIIYQV